MAAKRHRPSRPKAKSRPRSDEQKRRRKELWIAREADRRTAAQTRYLARYEELKLEMARHGQIIGTLTDVMNIEDPAHQFEVIKARVERWDALWSITLRKRDTRGKIIIGGAVLAEIALLDHDSPEDLEFRRRLINLLDQRVLRIRDRLLIRDLVTAAAMVETPLPLRPGGAVSENLEDALAAIGETFASFDGQAFRMAVADPSAEADDNEGTWDDVDYSEGADQAGDAVAAPAPPLAFENDDGTAFDDLYDPERDGNEPSEID